MRQVLSLSRALRSYDGRQGWIRLACALFMAVLLAFPISAAFAESDLRPNFSNYSIRQLLHLPAPPGGPEPTFFNAGDRIQDPHTGASKNTAFTQLCATGTLTERITTCIQEIITESMEQFLEAFSTAIQSYVLALIILAVTLFGVSILTGTAENPGGDAFMLLLKIGGILLFTGSATGGGQLFGGFLHDLFGIMETFTGFTASYMDQESAELSSFIQGCGGSGDASSGIWAKIDCVMARLFIGDPSYGLGVGLIWTLMGAVLWTGFMGPFIVLVFCIVFGFLVLLIVRCIFVFLASYAMLALIVIVSPLIIPLILFKTTKSMFDNWLKFFMAAILQPMILMGFLVFFFAVLDGLFFKENDYSLTAILGPNWEQLQWGASMPAETVDWQMETYAEESGNGPGSDAYEAYRAKLSEPLSLAAVGNVNLVQEQLIKIELNLGADAIRDTPVIGDMAGALVDFVEGGANWLLGEVTRTLFPFTVTRIQGTTQSTGTVIIQLMGFSMILLLLICLMMGFADDIPKMVLRLAGLRDVNFRLVGAVMPVERQIKGAIAGAKEGASVGMAGGAKGALIGAAVGAVAGAASADKDGRPQISLDKLQQRSSPSNPTSQPSGGGGGGRGGGGGGATAGKAGTAGKAAAGTAGKPAGKGGGQAILKLLMRAR